VAREGGECSAAGVRGHPLGLVVATLTNVLKEVTRRFRQAATMNEIEGTRLSAITERIASLHQEIDTPIREVQKLLTAHTL